MTTPDRMFCCGKLGMKHCLLGSLTVLLVSLASTTTHAHLRPCLDVAMVDPVDLRPQHATNNTTAGMSDLSRIAYTPARSAGESSISPALLNNAGDHGVRRAHFEHIQNALTKSRSNAYWRSNA